MDNKIWANFLPLKSHETTLAALIWLGKGAISTLHKTKATPYLSKIAPWCHRLDYLKREKSWEDKHLSYLEQHFKPQICVLS